MGILRQVQGQVVGIRKDEMLDLPSANHFKEASLTPVLRKQIKTAGLRRVAGSVYVLPSKNEFWKVRGGSIIRLTKTVEVDDGESFPGDSNFLTDALNELSF